MMRFRVTAPPTDEPIDLKMVRDTHLRGIPDDSSENDYLRQLIRAAREYCENYTGLSLGPQTLEALPDLFHGLNHISVNNRLRFNTLGNRLIGYLYGLFQFTAQDRLIKQIQINHNKYKFKFGGYKKSMG